MRLAQGVWKEVGMYGVYVCVIGRDFGCGTVAVLDKEEKLEELFLPSCMVSFALLSVILECRCSRRVTETGKKLQSVIKA